MNYNLVLLKLKIRYHFFFNTRKVGSNMIFILSLLFFTAFLINYQKWESIRVFIISCSCIRSSYLFLDLFVKMVRKTYSQLKLQRKSSSSSIERTKNTINFLRYKKKSWCKIKTNVCLSILHSIVGACQCINYINDLSKLANYIDLFSGHNYLLYLPTQIEFLFHTILHKIKPYLLTDYSFCTIRSQGSFFCFDVFSAYLHMKNHTSDLE